MYRQGLVETPRTRWQRSPFCGTIRIKSWTDILSSNGSTIPAPRKECEMNFKNRLTAFSWKTMHRTPAGYPLWLSLSYSWPVSVISALGIDGRGIQCVGP